MDDRKCQPWLRGWKAIAQYCGGMSVECAESLHKNYGMPVLEMPNGDRVAIPYELDMWLLNYQKLKPSKKA